MTEPSGPALTQRLEADLRSAMKARDRTAVTALRTALAALANAEAPDFDASAHPEGRGELVQHARLSLTVAEQQEVLREEVRRRERLLAEHVDGSEASPYAVALRAEVAVLQLYLG